MMGSITGVLWVMVAILAFAMLVIVGGLFLFRRWQQSGQERGY